MRFARANVLVACFSMVGAQHVCADSLDQWSVRASGTGSNLYAVTYGPGRFVAVGQTGTILVSTNGASWNPASHSVVTSLYEVAWGHGLFVAVGDGGTILTSPDAATWTSQSSPITNNLKAVRLVGDGFLVLGSGGAMLASTNGLDWVPRASGSTMTLQGVAVGNGTFCAVGGGNTHISSVTRSPDGITWSNQNVSFNYLYDVTFGNGVFVAQGIRGQVRRSLDGVNWIGLQAGNADYLFGATFAQGLFVAVGGPYGGDSQKIVTSPDGLNWKTRAVNTGLSPSLRAVAYGNGYFVAVGDKGIILQSGPVFRLTPGERLPAGDLQWILTGEIGRSYHFQYSDNLADPGWTDATNFTSVGETTLLSDPTAGLSSARLYRVKSP